MLAASAFIGVTNHGVTVWGRDANDLQDALVRHEATPFVETAPKYRGIPESTLHD